MKHMNKTRLISCAAMLLLAPILHAQESPPPPAQSGGFVDAVLQSLFGFPPAQSAPVEASTAEVSGDAVLMEFDEPTPKVKPGAPQEAKRIEIVDDFEEAIKLSQLEQRPLLVIAGAQWCSWCRKLEQELAKKEAEPILKKWIVAKIDVDDSPELAEEFEVSSLPSLRVLSADRRVAAKQEGFMPLADLQAWLEEAAPQVDPSLTRVLYDKGTPDDSQLKQLVEYLGNRSPALRQSAARRLMDTRGVSAAPIITLMGSGRLSQKLSAIEILRGWGAPVEGLDPWVPDSISAERIETLNAWLEKNAASPATETAPVPEVDPAKVKDTVTRLLQGPASQRQAVLSELLSYGPAVLPELRARLENAEQLDDKQRHQLRQLLLLALASDQTRGLHVSLLTALASLNAETHRQAAGRLLELMGPPDQPLIDELSQDADPLVREMTVPVLQRLSVLQTPERLEKLLSDKSPSVRTAVLREIAERPELTSIELLTSYAAKEKDEDLLVYTVKTLGELSAHEQAQETLTTLLEHESWRVRAAVLDAFGSSGSGYSDFSDTDVSKKLFENVLKATSDKDAFVVERAMSLMPKMIRANNMSVAVQFLIKHPERIESFWKEIKSYSKDEVAKGLSAAAMPLLEVEDATQAAGALALIAQTRPSALKRKLPELIANQDPGVRLAALKGTLAFMEMTRDLALKAQSQQRDPYSEDQPRSAWYPVPESFQSLPAPSPHHLMRIRPPRVQRLRNQRTSPLSWRLWMISLAEQHPRKPASLIPSRRRIHQRTMSLLLISIWLIRSSAMQRPRKPPSRPLTRTQQHPSPNRRMNRRGYRSG